MVSRRGLKPRFCRAETGWVGKPRVSKSIMFSSRWGLSDLLASSRTGRPLRWSRRATSSSRGRSPAEISTTKRMRAASAMAISAWASVLATISSSAVWRSK